MAIARQRIHLPEGCWRSAGAGLLRGDLWEGDAIPRFEREFADFVGVTDAVAVASGRAGLRFLLQALELPAGSPVVCSAFGYPVVPHLVRELGFELRFVDCELETLGMDPEALAVAITADTAAVIATHLYGVPCRIRELALISEARGAALIEDCAHCCGASVGGRATGAFGSGAYFSFETSKPINTLGGGMVTTRDAEVAARVREIASAEAPKDLRWLGRRLAKTSFEAAVTHPWLFDLAVHPALRLASRGDATDERFASGYAADEISLAGKLGRYTRFQADLGRAQLARVPERLARRRAAATRLIERLRGEVHFQRPVESDAESNWMLVTALFSDMRRVARALQRRGVDTKREYMRDCGRLFGDGEIFPNAARAEREVLHLPAYPELGAARIDRVAATLEAVLSEAPGPE